MFYFFAKATFCRLRYFILPETTPDIYAIEATLISNLID